MTSTMAWLYLGNNWKSSSLGLEFAVSLATSARVQFVLSLGSCFPGQEVEGRREGVLSGCQLLLSHVSLNVVSLDSPLPKLNNYWFFVSITFIRTDDFSI